MSLSEGAVESKVQYLFAYKESGSVGLPPLEKLGWVFGGGRGEERKNGISLCFNIDIATR
jgi:hypothetical protein